MKKLMLIYLLLLGACSFKPANTHTDTSDIYINSTQDLDNCKFVGQVEADDVENWQEQLRQQASTKGATHIKSAGPNGVGQKEIVYGNAYFCKK